MRTILLGPPGSGKGTQGDLIEKKYGFPKISTGDLLRRAVQEGTPLGKKAEAVMEQGELVSDALVNEIVRERIQHPDCRKGYVLDGYPRTLNQARELDAIGPGYPELAIDIHVGEDVLVKRLGARRMCSRCEAIYNLDDSAPSKEGICDLCEGKLVLREDDKPEVIRERLKIFRRMNEELVDYYRKKSTYQRIDGERAIDSIFKEVSSVLDKKIASLEVEAS